MAELAAFDYAHEGVALRRSPAWPGRKPWRFWTRWFAAP